MAFNLKRIGLTVVIVFTFLTLTAAYYPMPLPGNSGKVLISNGTKWTSANVDLADSDAVGATVLPIANGGTNKALTLSAGGIPYFDADSFEVLAAGSSGQLVTSGGSGPATWTTTAYGTSFTGTLANITNVGASTWSTGHYARIGNVGFMSFQIAVDPTSAAAETEVTVTPAVSSDFTAQLDCWGSIGYGADISARAIVIANATTNTCRLVFTPAYSSNESLYVQAMFIIR